jgi:hypothetical protein
VLPACTEGAHASVPTLPRLGPARDAYDRAFGDPFVIAANGTYVLLGTDDPPDHIPTATSSDLTP